MRISLPKAPRHLPCGLHPEVSPLSSTRGFSPVFNQRLLPAFHPRFLHCLPSHASPLPSTEASPLPSTRGSSSYFLTQGVSPALHVTEASPMPSTPRFLPVFHQRLLFPLPSYSRLIPCLPDIHFVPWLRSQSSCFWLGFFYLLSRGSLLYSAPWLPFAPEGTSIFWPQGFPNNISK